ncbi:NIPSNAP family protein [Methylobacterium komagatae]
MLYELTTLSCPLLAVGRASEGVYDWVNDAGAKGELFGCWRTEIGTLGRLIVLRGFEAPEDMTAERRRALLSANPFNAGSVVTALEMDSYAPFPFLPPIRTGDRGGVYEFRTYHLKPGGLPPTLGGLGGGYRTGTTIYRASGREPVRSRWSTTDHAHLGLHEFGGTDRVALPCL